MSDYESTHNLRFVQRDGRCILQQLISRYNGEAFDKKWADVPLVAETQPQSGIELYDQILALYNP